MPCGSQPQPHRRAQSGSGLPEGMAKVSGLLVAELPAEYRLNGMNIPLSRRRTGTTSPSNAGLDVLPRVLFPLHDSGLDTISYLIDLSEAEFYRADRYARPLALLVVEPAPNAEGSGLQRQLVDWLRASLRNADIVSHLGNTRYAILLPETGAYGAGRLVARLRQDIPEIAVGFSLYPQDGGSLGDLVVAARQAFNEARMPPSE